MALPWFFRKLFGDTGNNGKIVDDVIPDTVVKTSVQTLETTKQAQARKNIGVIEAVESYLVEMFKELCLENGATQAEIDAIENENS
jgi:hypothetical protein